MLATGGRPTGLSQHALEGGPGPYPFLTAPRYTAGSGTTRG